MLTELQIKPESALQNTVKTSPELIDGNFSVTRSRWGTWTSHDAEGKGLITGLTEEVVISATRFYLKGLQEGWGESTKSYEGTVGGKL